MEEIAELKQKWDNQKEVEDNQKDEQIKDLLQENEELQNQVSLC